MITEAHQKESLGLAYIQAVAGKVGLNLTVKRIHDYGVDGTFHQVQKINKEYQESGFSLDFQLKSSVNWKNNVDTISFDLDARAYNMIIRRVSADHTMPLILILFCMPQSTEKWLSLTENELTLRQCCYWHQFYGNETDNSSTIRIEIPIAQKLSPDCLRSLFQKIEQGERKLCL